jgi:starvation-inducible DNA-binding protein
MQPNLGLSDDSRAAALRLLGTLLADVYVLATRTRNYAWNVVGPQFQDLHQLFLAQYRELDERSDQVAQRIRALGGLAPGTLAEFLQHTRLREEPGRQPPAKEMDALLLADHEAVVRHLRADLAACDRIQDRGSSALLTEWLDRHERLAGTLRAFLATPAG